MSDRRLRRIGNAQKRWLKEINREKNRVGKPKTKHPPRKPSTSHHPNLGQFHQATQGKKKRSSKLSREERVGVSRTAFRRNTISEFIKNDLSPAIDHRLTRRRRVLQFQQIRKFALIILSRRPKLAQRASFDLANPFFGNSKLLAHLF